VQKLGAVVNFLDHMRKPIKEGDRKKGIYPYYGASGIIDYVDDYIFDGSYILLGEDGANILTRSSPLAFKVSGKIWVNNHAHIMEPKVPTDIDYITYYLESIRYEKYNTGTAQPKITQEVCQRIPIPFSKLIDERWKIGKILSTWDKAIELKEKLIEQKKELKKGLMQRLLTGKVRFSGFDKEWRSVPIESVCELSMGKTPSRKVQKYWGKGHKWIAISDMKDKYITNTQEEITDLALKETGIQVIPKGTVIMSFKLTLGRLAITGEDMYSNEAIVSFRIKNPDVLDYEFLYYYLSSIDITKYGSQAAKGITLNSDSLKEIMIKLPTKCEQIKIRDALCFYDKKIDLLEQELEALKQQKKGLMQLLLTGKVRVKC